MDTLPFTIPGVPPFELAHVEGVARLEGDALVLEFRTIDDISGMVKSALREVRLTPDDLESVSHRRGWFHDSVSVTARRMSCVASIPGANGVLIKLRCKRSHRRAVESLSLALRLRITDRDVASVLNS